LPLRKRIAVAVLVMVAVAFVQRQGFTLPGVLPFTPSAPKIDLPGPAVMIAYQDADLDAYTQLQRDAISGHLWTEKVPTGNWRVLDNEAEFTAPSPFQEPFSRRPKELPWVVVSGPGEQYEGTFASAAEVAQLVEGAKNE
jgi:hypothetical protein